MTSTQTTTASPRERIAPRDGSRLGHDRSPAGDLVGVMDALLREHEAIGLLITKQREAMSAADARALGPVHDELTRKLHAVRELDTRRQGLVAEITGSREARIEHVAAALEEPHRSAALDLGARLRAAVESVRREQGVIREAAVMLMQHMQGMVRQLHQTISHAGVYGNSGRVQAGAAVVTGVDLTT